jgi:cell wall-associated NlpC family hydrolase
VPAPRTSSTARPRSTAPGGPRRALSPQEARAIREALAARQSLTRELLSQQTATAVRPATPRSPSPAVRRTVRQAPHQGRPGTAIRGGTPIRPGTATRPVRRQAPARGTTVGRRPDPARPRRWPRRIGIVALGAVVLPALATVVLSGMPSTAPAPGSREATSLALTARTTLLHDAGRYRTLEQVVSRRRTELAHAEQARGAAQARADAERRSVGTLAAALYRARPTDRYPLLGLDAPDPAGTADVLHRQALADRAAEHVQRSLDDAEARADRTAAAVRTATQRVRQAKEALDDAAGHATAALVVTRADVHDLSTTVTAQLAALGADAQQARDVQALRRWQRYLAALAAAHIDLPSAADLADPEELPAGMSPALDAAHHPVPGVAWAVIGSRPVTVLPAETVAAVSSALAQLGKPYVPGTDGPASYDCGGFTATSWLLAGYAVPGSAPEQWRTGTPVAARDLQVGDLVFTDGARDVGIYLGAGEVLGASAATHRVGVRSLVAGSPAVRVTLGMSDRPNAAPAGTPVRGSCGAALREPKPVSPAWGGYRNGRIPAAALCPLGVAHHELRCDAATAYRAMSAAFRSAFGRPLCITDSYRPYTSQVDAYDRKPELAAYPGTSNHGWGLAVDLCGGVNVAGSPQWTWMSANAGSFGFVNPAWARPGGEKPEPWHWEYGYLA